MGAGEDALNEIFAKFNIEKPAELNVEQEKALDETSEAVRLEGEWLLYSLRYPLSPRITRTCQRCGEPFQTNYQGVAHCSNRCVVLELRDKFGIEWKPANRRDKEKWSPREPAGVIPADALRTMKKLVVQAEADLGKPLEIGVPVEKFVLPIPAPFGPRETVPESQYKLPDLEQPSLASPQPEAHPSHNQEALVQEDTSPEAPSPAPEKDAFDDLFAL